MFFQFIWLKQVVFAFHSYIVNCLVIHRTKNKNKCNCKYIRWVIFEIQDGTGPCQYFMLGRKTRSEQLSVQWAARKWTLHTRAPQLPNRKSKMMGINHLLVSRIWVQTLNVRKQWKRKMLSNDLNSMLQYVQVVDQKYNLASASLATTSNWQHRTFQRSAAQMNTCNSLLISWSPN